MAVKGEGAEGGMKEREGGRGKKEKERDERRGREGQRKEKKRENGNDPRREEKKSKEVKKNKLHTDIKERSKVKVRLASNVVVTRFLPNLVLP